jgi:hypothetical protein
MTGGCPFTDPDRLFQDLAVTRAAGGLPYAEPFEARMVSRYDDIVQARHDPDTYCSAPTVPEMPAPWRARFAARPAEHRDSVLDLEERLAGETMMTCVSRCRGQRLVLDL